GAYASKPLLDDLRELVKSANADYSPEQWAASSVMPVYDLLRNAERRAAQGRYDDAVARCYRAVELLAQNRLLAVFGIKSNNVDPGLAQEWLREQPERARRIPIKAGLEEDYAILLSKQDPLGLTFEKHHKSLQEMLRRRNASILAHGTKPIRKEEWPGLYQPVVDFLAAAIGAIGLKMRLPVQFPALDL
ncbi:MAG: TIGR02710 family CRISPR-associated CARF protein, partial [Chloroflexota bacterium]